MHISGVYVIQNIKKALRYCYIEIRGNAYEMKALHYYRCLSSICNYKRFANYFYLDCSVTTSWAQSAVAIAEVLVMSVAPQRWNHLSVCSACRPMLAIQGHIPTLELTAIRRGFSFLPQLNRSDKKEGSKSSGDNKYLSPGQRNLPEGLKKSIIARNKKAGRTY